MPSSDSTTIMFFPTSPRPPSGISRVAWDIGASVVVSRRGEEGPVQARRPPRDRIDAARPARAQRGTRRRRAPGKAGGGEAYRLLGREILDQLGGPPDALCAYVGTSGCFVGAGRELRSAGTVHRVAVEPAESPVLSGGRSGTHHIEGGGAGFWPPLLQKDDLD